ncbi:MAG: nitroreductase [Acidimicrobiales bacterium mtb01]|nr:nitroreductase family protein [Actinomycetota bacterium]TEX45253.1 MAG: nitroreductase [Acidimicrobiales bacterium mtb01]
MSSLSPDGDRPEDVSLLDGLSTTRAIRRYTADPIPDDHLNTIIWSASRAPSGSNRQPFRFLVLRDGPKARLAKSLLGEAFRRGWNAKRSSDGYDQIGDSSSPKARQARAMQWYVDHFEEIPVVVLVGLVRYRDPNPYEGASIYPACQNLLLAARALGYGGALTMWHQGVEPQLRELLAVPEDVALSACITLGRPQGSHGPVRRRPIGDLVFDDEWGRSADWVVDPDGTRFTNWKSS